MTQATLPAAADTFFKHTEKIQKGIRDLLEGERHRADETQRAVQTLQAQLKDAEASRQQLIEIANSAQKLLINSQTQLGGLVGAVESLLTGGAAIELTQPAALGALSERPNGGPEKPNGGPEASPARPSQEAIPAKQPQGTKPAGRGDKR